MLSLWLLAVEGSSTSAILAQLNADPSFACSYNHVWWPFLSSWIVKLASFLLFADWAVKRNLLVGSITWEANWELFYFPGPLSLQFLVQFTVYRLSRSLRLATAISDVARACRSKKKEGEVSWLWAGSSLSPKFLFSGGGEVFGQLFLMGGAISSFLGKIMVQETRHGLGTACPMEFGIYEVQNPRIVQRQALQCAFCLATVMKDCSGWALEATLPPPGACDAEAGVSQSL